MFQRKPRRFRRRSNGRGQPSHGNGFMQLRTRNNSFSSNQPRNSFRSQQSAEKLLEKYTALAKEAISSGDKTMGENYLQHADHFMRIVDEKNKNREQNKTNIIDKQVSEDKNLAEDSPINQAEFTKSKLLIIFKFISL